MFRFNLLKYSAKAFRSAKRLYFMDGGHHTTYTISTNIELNQTEKDIFNIFTDFVAAKNLNTTIRVAGGWVRDKVLGRESNDIDFAIDNMTGEQFVTQAYAYLKEKMDVRGFGVTKLNPEQSKHLETAKIEVQGIWIDVVNLRGETYGQDSRIPSIEIGTPEQDAFRRDLTINSLFYNVHTAKIEDFTQMGLSDLQNGVARTPLPPDQTFIDDPLRILRVIRFISRFDLRMDDKIAESLRKPEILENLAKKVSRERVGIELKQMLSAASAILSIRNFNKFQLFPYMVEIPSACAELVQNRELIIKLFEESYQLCEVADKYLAPGGNFNFLETLKEFFPPADIRFLLYLTMIVSPFEGHKVEVNPKTKKTEPLVPHLVKTSLKFTNNDADIIGLASYRKGHFKKLVSKLADGNNVLLETARVIKEMTQWAKTWELPFVLALANDLSDHEGEAQQVLAAYERLYKFIFENKLNQLFTLKPLLDGGQIQQLFQAKGPVIQMIKDNVFYWQIENPTKNLEDLHAYIAEHKDEFLKNRFE